MRVGFVGCTKAGALLAVVAWAGVASAQRLDDGRVPFDAYGCYQCHGYAGQGGAAPRIAPSQYPFEAFAAFVRRPANEMPAYSPSALSEDTLRAIYAYVRSIPEPPTVRDLPLLR